MSTTAEILRQAQERIRDPQRWCQGSAARDGAGKPCSPDSPEAAQWCAKGALWATCPDGVLARDAFEALDCAASLDGLGLFVCGVNDEQGHTAVMRMYDRAITLAEQG